MTKKSILIVGTGGYDIFTGLLYYYNYSKYANIYLANFTYTSKNLIQIFPKIDDYCHIIKYNMINLNKTQYDYFPEYELSRELNKTIFCILDGGLQNLLKTYKNLVERLDINEIFIVTTGCLSILSGIEKNIGSPVEEIMNMWCINKISQEKNINVYLSVLGLEINNFKSIKNDDIENSNYIDMSDIKKNINILNENNVILEITNLNIEDDCVKNYINVFKKCTPKNSLANCIIISSLQKYYGNYHHPLLEDKHSDIIFNINEDLSKIYILDLPNLIKHILYFDKLDSYDTSDDIDCYITKFNLSFQK